jgi:hypothetical protein
MNQVHNAQAEMLKGIILLGGLAGGGAAGLRWLMSRSSGDDEGNPLPSKSRESVVTLTNPAMLAKKAEPLSWLGGVVKSIDGAVSSLPGLGYGSSLPTAAKYTRTSIPLASLAAMLGLYGGYQGVTSLRDYVDKGELDSDEEKARARFETALQAQFNTASRMKRAMEEVEEQPPMEKTSVMGDYINAGLGGVTAAGALVWYLTHQAMRERMKKTDTEALELKLLKQRQNEDAARQTSPIEIDISTPGVGEEETALERALRRRGELPFVNRRA